jgi:uncharacterized membrane protein YeaQ/YmgE (transglycosylase-associated protein family)
MGWILNLIVGAIIGWLASKIMKTDQQQGTIANILIGIVGSALGKFVFQDLLNIGAAGSAGAISVVGIFWGVAGAALLIWILKAFKVLR